jgi:hypothetical protein
MKKRDFCLAMAVLAGSIAVGAQDVPTPPPIKMGLWQNTVTNTMSGLQLPPDVVAKMQAMGRPIPGSTPRTMVMQSCVTQDNWRKSFTDMQQNKNCQITNLKQTTTSMSGDLSCTTAEGTTRGHVEAAFSGQEKMNGKVHMEITTSRQPEPIVMDTTFEGEYQGADCKGVSPDSPKIVHMGKQ